MKVVLSSAYLVIFCRVIMGIVVTFFVYNYFYFDEFNLPLDEDLKSADAGIVFTGAYERIDAGIKVVDRRLLRRLYISGLNGGAGLSSATFVEQFQARNRDVSDLAEIVNCCIEYGVNAETTFQNALEAKCWLDSSAVFGKIILITSQSHMPRAIAELRGALGWREILPFPVFDVGPLTGEARAKEYLRYLIASAMRFIPASLDPRDAGLFAGGCPENSINVNQHNQLDYRLTVPSRLPL